MQPPQIGTPIGIPIRTPIGTPPTTCPRRTLPLRVLGGTLSQPPPPDPHPRIFFPPHSPYPTHPYPSPLPQSPTRPSSTPSSSPSSAPSSVPSSTPSSTPSSPPVAAPYPMGGPKVAGSTLRTSRRPRIARRRCGRGDSGGDALLLSRVRSRCGSRQLDKKGLTCNSSLKSGGGAAMRYAFIYIRRIDS